MAHCVLQLMALVRVVPVGWVKSAINVSARKNTGGLIVQRFATATTTIQNCVILGLGSAFVRLDGMVKPVPDLVHSIHMARVARIVVIARITRNAHR